MKKIFSLLWGLAIIVLSTISCTFAYTQEQQEAYQWAYRYRITTQPTIKDANLGWNITRQELSKMIVNYLENLAWVNWKASNLCSFTDENKANNELRNYAKKACAYKIMWSNWSDFRPRDKVTRAELWTDVSRVLDLLGYGWEVYLFGLGHRSFYSSFDYSGTWYPYIDDPFGLAYTLVGSWHKGVVLRHIGEYAELAAAEAVGVFGGLGYFLQLAAQQ